MWFAEFTPQGEIGKIDPQTLHVTKWVVPSPKAFPRRIQIDSDGTVWFCEFVSGKLGRFDPKTERITEFDLPGPRPRPMRWASTASTASGFRRSTWTISAGSTPRPAR